MPLRWLIDWLIINIVWRSVDWLIDWLIFPCRICPRVRYEQQGRVVWSGIRRGLRENRRAIQGGCGGIRDCRRIWPLTRRSCAWRPASIAHLLETLWVSSITLPRLSWESVRMSSLSDGELRKPGLPIGKRPRRLTKRKPGRPTLPVSVIREALSGIPLVFRASSSFLLRWLLFMIFGFKVMDNREIKIFFFNWKIFVGWQWWTMQFALHTFLNFVKVFFSVNCYRCRVYSFYYSNESRVWVSL